MYLPDYFIITAITCPPPLTIKSEGLEIEPLFCANSTSEIPYATVCRFTCKNGYQLQGPGLKTCQPSKIWKPLENPSCIGLKEGRLEHHSGFNGFLE